MRRFANTVVAERHSRFVNALVFVVIGAVLLGTVFLFVRHRLQQEVRAEVGALLARQTQLDRSIREIAARLNDTVTAEPCSQTYREQLHHFAYLPDGISEYFQAPGGWVLCSLNVPRFAAPVGLGIPDLTYGDGSSIWIDRDLAAFGLAGMKGSLVVRRGMGFIVPPQEASQNIPQWLELAAVLRRPDGRRWHRDGMPGLYEASLREPDGSLRGIRCDDGRRHCVAFRAHPLRFLAEYRQETALFGIMLAAMMLALAGFSKARLRRYYSFESRFRRHLNADTIVCSYQLVMDLRSDRIVGCEVLARWRDVDGSIVMPDRFIPLIERDGLTLEFTRSIVEKAMRELSTTLPKDVALNVAFNVFPGDLADKRLPDVFRVCRAERERFAIVAEIVESAAFCADDAGAQIDALRREGIGVYLDDFGAGYSNIQNLAALPVEGVKLDRAFAMAPDDSLMARMLANAIGLINVSGRVIVVEGVETANKIEHLRSLEAPVDRVQGYHISRPLPIDTFANFLAARRSAECRPMAA